MRHKSLVFVLAVFIFIIESAGISYSYLELDGGAVGVTGRGEVPLNVQALLDDFNTQAVTNAWNCLTGTFSKSNVVPPPANERCTASYSADTPGGTGYSLKLDYDVSRPYEPGPPEYSTFAGYYSQLGGGSLVTPTAYTAVSFWIKGAVGGEFFKIEIKNKSTAVTYDSNDKVTYHRNAASVYITDYLDGGVTTTWQKVTIPFHNFANLDGWSSMKEFVIVFENAQNTYNVTAKQGIIYIDDIVFETTPINAVRVDHFGDKLGVCALGGGMGTGTGGGASAALNKYSFSNVSNEYSPYPNGMKLEYNVSPLGSYAYTFLIFGGGNDIVETAPEKQAKAGWIAVPHDFSAYNWLYVSVKAKSGTENPKTMRIELVDNTGTKFTRITGITTSWQTLPVPLIVFPGLNKANIKQLTFVFEGDWIGTAVGNKTGTVYIDSVEFQK